MTGPFAISLSEDFVECFDLNGLFCCKDISALRRRKFMDKYLFERRSMVMSCRLDHGRPNEKVFCSSVQSSANPDFDVVAGSVTCSRLGQAITGLDKYSTTSQT